MKLNHNQLLTYPNQADQIMFASVEQAFDMGAVAVGATIYFGSEESDRQIQEVSQAFAHAHELGMVTVLWCYLRNSAFKIKAPTARTPTTTPRPTSPARPTTSARRSRPTSSSRSSPTNNGGYVALNMGGSSYGKFDPRIYTDLAGSTRKARAATRSTCAATNSPTATWAAAP